MKRSNLAGTLEHPPGEGKEKRGSIWPLPLPPLQG